MSTKKTFKCNLNKDNYLQNNKINLENKTTVSSMLIALDYAGYKFPIIKDDEKIEDVFLNFCFKNKEVLDFYKNLSPTMFDAWYEEYSSSKETDLKEIEFKNSYPPTEVHSVLSYATNKFLGIENATTFNSSATLQEIIKELTEYKPVIVSAEFGKNNYTLCLTGVVLETNDNGESWTPVKFYADDIFGKYDIPNEKYLEGLSGIDSEYLADDLIPTLKSKSSQFKYAHFFNLSTPVV